MVQQGVLLYCIVLFGHKNKTSAHMYVTYIFIFQIQYLTLEYPTYFYRHELPGGGGYHPPLGIVCVQCQTSFVAWIL